MSARLFDGSDDEIIADIVDNTGDFSEVIWLRPVDATPAATSALSGFQESGDPGTHEKQLALLTNGHLRAYIYDGTTRFAEGTTVLSNDTWHLAGLTHDIGATTLRIFLDGVEEGSNGSASASFNYTAPDFYAGIRGSSDGFNGRLAWATCWSVQLAANEMVAMHRGVPPSRIRPKDQLICWPVWGLHSLEIDLSGNGRSGTVTGTTKANGPPVRLFTPPWAASVPLIETAAAAAARRRVAVGAGWATRR